MLFVEPNIPALKSCWKRAERFAKEGVVEGQHRVWQKNAQAALAYDYDAGVLNWVAERVDAWCQDNIIEGNTSMAALLYWWKGEMFFDPTALPDGLEAPTAIPEYDFSELPATMSEALTIKGHPDTQLMHFAFRGELEYTRQRCRQEQDQQRELDAFQPTELQKGKRELRK